MNRFALQLTNKVTTVEPGAPSLAPTDTRQPLMGNLLIMRTVGEGSNQTHCSQTVKVSLVSAEGAQRTWGALLRNTFIDLISKNLARLHAGTRERQT